MDLLNEPKWNEILANKLFYYVCVTMICIYIELNKFCKYIYGLNDCNFFSNRFCLLAYVTNSKYSIRFPGRFLHDYDEFHLLIQMFFSKINFFTFTSNSLSGYESLRHQFEIGGELLLLPPRPPPPTHPHIQWPKMLFLLSHRHFSTHLFLKLKTSKKK